MKSINIALVQTKVSENIEENVKKTAKLIEQAAKAGAKIVALQELFQTPYFPQWKNKNKDDYAEKVTGPTVTAMKKIARKLKITLIVPFYEKISAQGGPASGWKDKYFNTAVVIDKNGKLLGRYHKIHIPQDPSFYEKEYFREGELGYKIFSVDGIKFAVLICYDQWFPEAARLAKLSGAEIIFYPTAIGNIIGDDAPEGDWHDAWETVQRGHAIANSVYVAAINRVGREGQTRFFGQSFISDPFGKIIKRASPSKEAVLVAKLDLGKNKFIEKGWGFMRNRRPDTYKPLAIKTLKK
ncbi:hypothetical protein A2917_00300 [Candidatus Nomurabacteria bacterium RIFCSPLOWO2_01_FULL_42_17]|uniref:CN hydrolase domain-containing protein n=1 Tax=Candidatus Nomurabacteria bacterium RIFCSPLOWO2_01_FULL_42_17 TaxID=1801780 RepID=A0A1F6XNM9_9BACT|nr:MAG: hypothetical protein A2917_00300 [Candidatus Nomurabacteria bacterium RIFCSPLOWO2_01_FULL_42_17]